MRADEYVVNKLVAAENEASEFKARNIFLMQENRELENKLKKVCSLFECSETTGGNGYQITINDADGHYEGTLIYCWDKENPTENFLNWLEILGLSLPIDEPKTEELEKDPELVAQALEKAKELQAEQETEKAVEEK